MMASSLHVLVTGAAGQIAYSLMSNIARGTVFGPKRVSYLFHALTVLIRHGFMADVCVPDDEAINLVMFDIEPMMGVLKGVEMELIDCAFPLLTEILLTSDIEKAFKDIDVAVFVGAMPRREGMERKDLLSANVKIFKQQGQALEIYAKKSVKVLVVGNPANTNAFICKKYAPSIPAQNFTSMTRLDENRVKAQIAMRVGASCQDVKNVIIWGNHSVTQYPDVSHATVKGKAVVDTVVDEKWIRGDFITTIQKRGASVIAARKLSSAMSAAKAICDHLSDWFNGTGPGEWVWMGVVSDGSYGIEKGLVYSMPVKIGPIQEYTIVQGLTINEFSRSRMDATMKELVEERKAAEKVCDAN